MAFASASALRLASSAAFCCLAFASAKKAQEEAAQKKGEAKKIASSAKRDFEQKIRRA
ncbi:hypothetical protein IAF36_12700, partial [Acinetobacter baumannii]|nr:hypothetical protein [Acinetobacter baumannii]